MNGAQLWSGSRSRRIVARIVVEGVLELTTPAHLGNGDGDDLTDMPLLLDPCEGRPLLIGASLAGALRAYLRAVERRDHAPLPQPENDDAMQVERDSLTVALFGGCHSDDQGYPSSLIVDDALADPARVEFRDGVALDPRSRTAEDAKLFDLQMWPAGTRFPLRFELCVRRPERQSEEDNGEQLCRAFCTALHGLGEAGITLGARKQRGYGAVKAGDWRVRRYDLAQPGELMDWLERGDEPLPAPDGSELTLKGLCEALGVRELLPDTRQRFRLTAMLAVDSSLLIRSGTGTGAGDPDMTHLRSYRPGSSGEVPILSGTSLGGALRARAVQILAALECKQPETAAGAIFGRRPDVEETTERDRSGARRSPTGGRVIVREAELRGGRPDWVQSRVSIDRFTGGARHGALFDQQPFFGNDDGTVTLSVELINPQDAEIGLFLLLLKDLWTGDLPLGGERSIGRGRMRGLQADLFFPGAEAPVTLSGSRDGLEVPADARGRLERYVEALRKHAEETRV